MASSYSTSLKLELIGNGEQSGVWGTTTNKNFGSLVEQAITGVQIITMTNSDYTLSNLNGTIDEARNAVLVIQGTNSAIRKIIAPSVEKTYVISNQTTGGYSITIGSTTGGGATITIPNGTTCQVYCDGTNFYSALTGSAGDFNVNGTFTTNTLATNNDITVNDVTVGVGAGDVSTNTVLGNGALTANTTGGFNVAIGSLAMAANTAGFQNTAINRGALSANTTGNYNNAVGVGALGVNTTGSNNNAFGLSALAGNTTGNSNNAFGFYALPANTTGSGNVAFGFESLFKNTTADNNVGIGNQAGANNTTGNLVAVGYQAGYSNTTGTSNTAIGYLSLASNTTAANNTAVGYQAGYSGTTSPSNTLFGRNAGYSLTTSAGGNTLVGVAAGNSLTTGSLNTFVGPCIYASTYGSGDQITTGSKNTIVGAYNGNQGSLDIRTASNYIVLSDGDGNPRQVFNSSGALGLNGANYGTAGQALISNGSSAVPTWGSTITSGTVQTSTSGTSIDFTGIPSWVKRITVMFNGVSTNGTSSPIIQVGSGSITTTAYSSAFGDLNGANSCGVTSSTTGIIFSGRYLSGASSAIYGTLILTTLGSNIWTATGASTSNNISYQGGGGVTLSGVLDRVRLTTVNGTDTFDAGSINILYE